MGKRWDIFLYEMYEVNVLVFNFTKFKNSFTMEILDGAGRILVSPILRRAGKLDRKVVIEIALT